MKKIAILMTVLSSMALGAVELQYEDFSYQEPVIKTGLKEAKQNVKTTFVYNENDMYRVYARTGFLTTIYLNSDEEVIYLAGGDTARWAIDEGVTGSKQGERKAIVLKPFYPGIKTNLVVNTNKRSYNFFLQSANEWYNPVVEFVYPQEAKIAKMIRANNEETTSLVNLNNLNNKYEWNNKKYNWSPQQVFDDGQKTYIVMKPEMSTGEAPALFIKDDQTGKVVLVRYRVKNNYYIVDRLFEQAVLKLGKREVVIKKDGSFIKNEKDYYPIRM
ncbi:TrbG/VirB9 family P-type conjugative transfer protein [uncultured Cetobacterium sp.]|uniref:TrbG/VirB9 family P-type conjugative transfer protein n=1 Tax=uncultured Cetobacterium sp. TaxID=527638 RepID=UPI0025F3B345|nr:TrbG/VirB9 family P-type conjugative transfer protein [uncultured Cetobacterium sp.]